ncbi:DNA-binding transcriptional regulator, CsgD family [Cohaesibacter marisflavi]|uniref:DNA-binding transcriptional regulator, CsgD family n=1 Tax=Cohaesibacter marisflavi TaxID=655353 RepID=A0A1I4ZH69_9HYPH|nr:LuxR family transcriptional regulator [Cohaesibacter marisflavi]SFN49614.1 DNA-binding transcriptional regulator, CsgD family [Cohaesibacter marisflavi]
MSETSDRFLLLRETIFREIKEAENVEKAVFELRDGYRLGHVTYHMAQTVTADMQIDAPFVRTTYPPDWIAIYLTRSYVTIDPVVKEGLRRSLPFDWSEIEPTEEAMEMMTEFQVHGMGEYGYSIPITDKVGRRALLSVNSRAGETNWSGFVKSFRQDWMELAHVLHKKAIIELFGDEDPVPVLSPRELEILHWSAKGKDYKEIALIVGISEHTVRTYMRSARYKLNCSNMSQAVAKAITLHLIGA